ncbi:hypothetical protein [Streptomyces sp. NPDC048438]|uniref:hypothetical protein n=1 Tax=Streptomyces sp. NPDC048438 TaxID=3365551 RepID=UPI0037103E22
MSDDKPIPLEGIPVFTGNLATLDVKVTELTSAGTTIATATGDIHSSFGGLQAFYQAPEAEQLFATTKPVETSGQTLKSDLKTIAGALSTYSDEVHPLVEKLKEIKRDAGAFLVKINADDKWREDGDLIEENNRRRDEIAETLAAFQEAETACYNKIVALVCLLPLKTSDGSDSPNQYGYDAETLKHAEGLPWGDPLVESTPGWQVWEHAWDFTKGFFVDGVWGTIKGLGTLVGFDGWDAAGQAWKGLAQLGTGLIVTAVAGPAYWMAKDEDLPSWLRDSRTAMKETGKALVAWDQWGENPSRAAGAVTFNVVTTVFTGGTGGAVAGGGKAALAAKALSAAGKVGRFVDPMTYVFKGAGFGLTKVGDAMAGLKGLGTIEIPPLPDNVFTLPQGAVRLPDGTIDLPAGATLPDGAVRLTDGTVRLPEGVIALPEGTVKLPEELASLTDDTVKLPDELATLPEGTVKSPSAPRAAYWDIEGNLYDESGNLLQRGDEAGKEAGKTDTDANNPDHARVETPVQQPVLVGAGARVGDGLGDVGRAGDDAIRMGDSLSDELGGAAGAGDNVPGSSVAGDIQGSRAGELGSGPSGGREQPGMSGDGPLSGHSEGRSGEGYGRPAGGHSNAPGGSEGGPSGTGPDGPGERTDGSGGPGGWEKPLGESGPLDRGGKTEQQIRDQMRGTKTKPGDLENVLDNLANNPAGREIAETIASGKFKNAENFDQVISSLSQFDKMPGGIEQLRLANRLHASGVHDISFEIKGDIEIKPGVRTGDATDLDVMARDMSGNVHGYQFKEIQNPKKVINKIFNNMKQLETSGADFKTFVVDTKGTLADHLALRTQQRLTDVYGKTNIQFIIRVEDGVLTIPPSGTFTPEVTP